jgi:hypothetical protein
MKSSLWLSVIFAGASVGMAGVAMAQPANTMSFFITSEGKGDGANLGGLAGADAYCAALAKAAGSTKTTGTPISAPARTRAVLRRWMRATIGNGPWVNAKGVTIARNVDDLHSALTMTCC